MSIACTSLILFVLYSQCKQEVILFFLVEFFMYCCTVHYHHLVTGNLSLNSFIIALLYILLIFAPFQDEKIAAGEQTTKELRDEQQRIQKTNQSLQVCSTD